MAFKRIAAVTGANKGIGLAIVRNLALGYPYSAFNDGPLLIYLTARDKGRGEEAVKILQNDAQLRKAKALAADGGLATIKYHGLDISKPKSITDFAAFLKKEHPDGIDMVINNAGVAMTGFGTRLPPLHHIPSVTSKLLLTQPSRHQRSNPNPPMQLLRYPPRHNLPPPPHPPRRPSRKRLQHVGPPQFQIL